MACDEIFRGIIVFIVGREALGEAKESYLPPHKFYLKLYIIISPVRL